jgi:serine/threonine protein kinase
VPPIAGRDSHRYRAVVTEARNFALRERLGEGGFGVVYRARQDHLDRDVASK